MARIGSGFCQKRRVGEVPPSFTGWIGSHSHPGGKIGYAQCLLKEWKGKE